MPNDLGRAGKGGVGENNVRFAAEAAGEPGDGFTRATRSWRGAGRGPAMGLPDRPRAAARQTRTGRLVPKTARRSILGQAPGVDERAIDLGHPSDFGEDGGRPATGIGGRPP